MAQKNVLGKGLGAIFPDLLNDFDKKKSVFSCGIEELRPNRYQPRKSFNDNSQKQLIVSIKNTGIIQPIVVRKLDDGYEIIAGERRWRAAQVQTDRRWAEEEQDECGQSYACRRPGAARRQGSGLCLRDA